MKVSPVVRVLLTVEAGGLMRDLVGLVDLTHRAAKKSNYTWGICPLKRLRILYVECSRSMAKLPTVSCPLIVILDVCVDLHSLPCLPRKPKRLVRR